MSYKKIKAAALSPLIEEVILESNFKLDSFYLEVHPYLDAEKNDRKHWLQIRFYALPMHILPGSNIDKISFMDWEVTESAETEVGSRYILNFLNPLELLAGSTKEDRDLKVSVSQDFIQKIIDHLIDDNNTHFKNLLNDCTGFENKYF